MGITTAEKISTFKFGNLSVTIPDTSPDILLINAPLTVTEMPFMAGAVLKAVANKAGHSCSTVDLNRLTLKWMQYQHQQHQSDSKSADLVNVFLNWGAVPDPKIIDNCQDEIDQWLSLCVSLVQQYNPKILGISVFTDCSRVATKFIAEQIKKHCPNVKILIGGHGIFKGARYGVSDSISFGEKLLREGLVDYYIQGDAEQSFYEFLKNNLTFSGINNHNWQQLNNDSLAVVPYPDYSDYDWSIYKNRAIGITGSRGCVRECKFCDYIVFHKKFTWRGADNIFEEMLYQKNFHNISLFHFSDSLINGNMKEFKKLMELLSDYNNQNPTDKLHWVSFFIFRPEIQFKEELWKLVAESGCRSLSVGVETFSDRVREHMGKGFNNVDLNFNLEMAAKYRIHLALMLVIGYATETEQDFEENLTWLTENRRYRSGLIFWISTAMVLLPGSWLDQHKDSLNITMLDPQNRETWANTETGNTLTVRMQRRDRLIKHARSLDFTVIDDYDPHALLESALVA